MPKLKLKVTHTHAGVAYPAGHVVDVDEHTARWLVERGIAALANDDIPDAPEPTAQAPRSQRTHVPKE